MKNIVFLTIFTSITLTACSKDDVSSNQVNLTEAPKAIDTVEQEAQLNFAPSKDEELSETNPKVIDCESSPEAYQACMAKERSEVVKNGLPTEFHGNWVSSSDLCSMDNDGYYINAESFNGYEDPCEIEKADRTTSIGHIKLTLKCPEDYTDESSGFYERFVTIIITNNKLEVSDDSRDKGGKPYELVRCP